MTNANLNLNINPELLTQAEEVFAKAGFSVSEAINTFMQATVNIGEIPFCTDSEYPPLNAETLAAMQETEDILSGKIQAKSYNSVEEMVHDILAEDDDDA